LYSFALSKNPFVFLVQGCIVTLNIVVLAKILFANTREFNKRVVKEVYQIDISEYTKAFQAQLMRAIFINNIVIEYPKYEDLMADYDEEFHPNNPDIEKNFWKIFLLLTGLVGFLGNFLLDGGTLKAKFAYLIFIVAFVLLPIILISFFLLPIFKDGYRHRYKKNKIIIAILEEIKKTINQFPSKYIGTVDLKTLILDSGLIENTFLTFF
jgi:hypothetical protein